MSSGSSSLVARSAASILWPPSFGQIHSAYVAATFLRPRGRELSRWTLANRGRYTLPSFGLLSTLLREFRLIRRNRFAFTDRLRQDRDNSHILFDLAHRYQPPSPTFPRMKVRTVRTTRGSLTPSSEVHGAPLGRLTLGFTSQHERYSTTSTGPIKCVGFAVSAFLIELPDHKIYLPSTVTKLCVVTSFVFIY